VDGRGRQSETADAWRPEDFARPLEPRVRLRLRGRTVRVRAWRHDVRGVDGRVVPVLLLDTDVPGNHPRDRRLTDHLYGGDDGYRLRQEAILGIGGVRMLRALGHARIRRFHLNEGHAALAALELLDEASSGRSGRGAREAALARVRARCAFTTHTPVPAGHDCFSARLARPVLGERAWKRLAAFGVDSELNLTRLALAASGYTNAVAMRHGEVSREMFPGHEIRAITNGVHPLTWAAPSFSELFDRRLPEWRRNPFALRHAVGIPAAEIARAHALAKRELLQRVERETGQLLDAAALTLGFARRATGYKRAALLLSRPERLASIARRVGPLQIVFAGKAHPRDRQGKAAIRAIHRGRRALAGVVQVAFLPDYGLELGRLLCAGADVWVNTPIPPLEASGTSGMKAALNGVPSLSVLDGWWVEGCVEGVTGWAIGRDGEGRGLPARRRDALHADALYRKLRRVVAPCFYERPAEFREVQRQAIARNGSWFHTQRMALEYLREAYAGAVPRKASMASGGSVTRSD
jgi:starch phosphorylase